MVDYHFTRIFNYQTNIVSTRNDFRWIIVFTRISEYRTNIVSPGNDLRWSIVLPRMYDYRLNIVSPGNVTYISSDKRNSFSAFCPNPKQSEADKYRELQNKDVVQKTNWIRILTVILTQKRFSNKIRGNSQLCTIQTSVK